MAILRTDKNDKIDINSTISTISTISTFHFCRFRQKQQTRQSRQSRHLPPAISTFTPAISTFKPAITTFFKITCSHTTHATRTPTPRTSFLEVLDPHYPPTHTSSHIAIIQHPSTRCRILYPAVLIMQLILRVLLGILKMEVTTIFPQSTTRKRTRHTIRQYLTKSNKYQLTRPLAPHPPPKKSTKHSER